VGSGGLLQRRDTSVQVDRGEAKQMKAAQRSAITVRAWNGDGLVGITSTFDLSAEGLERALMGASEASAFGNPDDTPAFSPLATAALEPLDQPLHEPVNILQLLDTLKDAERQLLGRHAAIETVPYNGLAQRRSQRLDLNSAGASRQQAMTTASLYLYARTEERGRKPRSAGAAAPGLWRRRPRHCRLHR
jgi:PmbA protein